MLDLKLKEENRQAIDRAMTMLRGIAHDDLRSLRGRIVPHQQLARTFGVQYKTPAYYNLTYKLGAKLLAEHGISMEAVTAEGYQFNTPKGQLGNARSKLIQGARRFRKASTIAGALPSEECTDMADLRVKSFLEECAAQQEREARRLSRQAAFLARPTLVREPIRLEESA